MDASATLPEPLRAAVERLVERFRPVRVILFGSHAWGTPSPDSDFDLVVLVRGPVDERRLAGQMRSALRGIPAAFDLIVRDVDRWKQWGETPLTLEYRVQHDGRVLHDAA